MYNMVSLIKKHYNNSVRVGISEMIFGMNERISIDFRV